MFANKDVHAKRAIGRQKAESANKGNKFDSSHWKAPNLRGKISRG